MRNRSFAASTLLIAICTSCTATGVHRKHDLRFFGGTNFPQSDVVSGMTDGEGDNKTWGIEYIYSRGRGLLGFELGAFQSITDGSGQNELQGLGLGDAQVEKKMDEIHLGMNYPLPRFFGLESDLGLGLAYLDTSIKSDISGGSSLRFEDQTPAAYAKIASMLPITDSFGIGADVRYLGAFSDFEDEQQNVSYDAQLSQWQATLFVALTW